MIDRPPLGQVDESLFLNILFRARLKMLSAFDRVWNRGGVGRIQYVNPVEDLYRQRLKGRSPKNQS